MTGKHSRGTNMAIAARALLVTVIAIALSGCALIMPPLGGGAQMSSNDSTGEAWYVKNRYFLFFMLSSNVYHCDGKGTCKEADME